MKTAILSPACWRTPPRKYGPWEQVASNIAEGLIKRGVDVTLFATADSITSGKLEAVCEKPYGENPDMDAKVCECLHISHFMEMSGEFDILHNNYDFLPLTYTRLIKTPMVTTIHGFSSPKIIPVFRKYNDNNYYVSISNSDRSPELDYIATVYNGIRVEDFTFREKGGDYLLFFGRIHPEKGTFESIQIAKKAKRKLIISGLIQDQKYFDEKIAPYVNDDDIVYVGNSGPEKRDRLLGHAYALLHPVSFEEPFGLSVAEAMCCGTPVIAFTRGSMPELIMDGKTGFLVNTVEEAVDALSEIKNIERSFCRQWVVSNFSIEKMIDGYLAVYTQVLEKKK
ncbi:MAG: glycosyltransferase family 4 protein [Chlorobi bacterium]|nr:glycosyltransferase family 4 protein [Chlorobiota bacterium]